MTSYLRQAESKDLRLHRILCRDLEKKLDPKHFGRIRRATVVNFAWIREMSGLPGGSLNVRLKDGKDLTVARDRARGFKDRVGT